MLQSKVQKALNDQLNKELSAYYTYLSMSAYLEASNLKGFAGWMRHHAEEEMSHAMKIYDYILRSRGRVLLSTIAAPETEWADVLSVLKTALVHEEKVTASIHSLVKLARSEADYATDSFLQWFVDEQVEEEDVVDGLLQKVELIGDHKPALFLLDRDLASELTNLEEPS